MRFCLVVKNDFRDCPPLHRLLTRLSQDGHSVEVYCIGDRESLQEYKLPMGLGEVRVVAVARARGMASHFRPLLEIPRLSTVLASSKSDYDICIPFDPYALEAVRQSKIAANVPIVYYSLELWDESRFWPQRLCERVGRDIISALICPQEDRLRYLKDKLQFSGPSMVFPNVTFDYVAEQPHILDKISTRPPTVFAYLGGLQLRKRSILELVEVFGNRVEDARLVIYGRASADDEKRLEAKLATIKYPQNISLNDFMPYGKHFISANEWHIGVMLYANVSLNYRYCAPNKLYEYTMLGLPILASNQPHLKREIEGEDFGICVNPSNPSSIEWGVRRLVELDSLYDMRENARKWYLSHGDYDTYYHQFLNLCMDLLD